MTEIIETSENGRYRVRLVADEGAGNPRSAISAYVDGDVDSWDADKLKQWQESGMEGNSPPARVVLNRMAQDGAIPKGSYLIEVCW